MFRLQTRYLYVNKFDPAWWPLTLAFPGLLKPLRGDGPDPDVAIVYPAVLLDQVRFPE
jgi:hypothetical protein